MCAFGGLLSATAYGQSPWAPAGLNATPSATPSDSLHPKPDSAAATTATKRIQIVRRQFNYRHQIGFAFAMMLFIAIILTSTQSWNP
jgi:hypothetical protein